MTKDFNPLDLKKLYMPSPSSHKGQNGKLLVVVGSKLFVEAVVWFLLVGFMGVDFVF